MAFVPHNNNGVATATTSAPVVLPTGTTSSTGRALTTLNYDFITNTVNGWYDTLGFTWVSLTVYGQANASAVVTFEACNETTTGARVQVFLQDASSNNPSRTGTHTITANTGKIFQGTVPCRYFRVRVSTTGSGTASVYGHWRQSPVPASNPAIGPLVTGNNLFGSTLAGVNAINDVPTYSFTITGKNTLSAIMHPAAFFPLGATGTPAASFSFNMTSVTGNNPTMDVVIQESYDDGVNWVSLFQFERMTTTGAYSTPTLRINGNAIRYYGTGSGTNVNFQFNITRNHKSAVGVNYRNFYDRSLNTTQTGGSNGALFYVQGTSSVQMSISAGATTSAASLQMNGSVDGVNWMALGATLNATANSTATTAVVAHSVKWVRVNVVTTSNAQTLNFIHLVAYGI